ncbi:MAG: serine/threonine-protein kinase [Myxococcota bacterium]
MKEPRRYCPECDQRTNEESCPIHKIPTFPVSELSGLSLETGRVVAGRYEIVELLGRGAMGAVYVARQLSVDRRVALKMMSGRSLLDGEESLQRFYREVRNATRINHPNVVRIHEFGVDEDLQSPFLVMELLEGQTLSQYLQERGRLELGEACGIAIQISRALAAAHTLGIVHRDLKPDNVIVQTLPSEDLHVTVLDFGIAKRITGPNQAVDNLTGTGMIVGTPRYMSPEQVNAAAVRPQSDLYALGCIFYELIEGRPPFASDNDSNVLFKHATEAPPRFQSLPPGTTSEQAEALYLRLMAKVPEKRPGSAAEVTRAFALLAPTMAESSDGMSLPSIANAGTLLRRPSSASGAGLPPSEVSSRQPGEDGDAATAASASPPLSHEGDSGATGPHSEGAWGLHPAALSPEAFRDLSRGLEVQRPRRRRRTALLAAFGVSLIVLGGVGVGRMWSLAPPPNPLLEDDSVLGCPVWEAKGSEDPGGWLGAAASDAFCRRARWVLGGKQERTRLAAELLGFEAIPSETFDLAPYDAPELRTRSLEAARAKTQAWFDGTVSYRAGEGFTVEVELVGQGGAMAGPFIGTGRAPFEASEAALRSAVSLGALPRREALHPEVAHWWMLDSVEAGLDLEELYDHTEAHLDLEEWCGRPIEPNQSWARALYGIRCDYRYPDLSFFARRARTDPRLVGEEPRALAWSVLASLHRADDEEERDHLTAKLDPLRQALEDEDSLEGRFILELALVTALFKLKDPLYPTFARRLVEKRPQEQVRLRERYGVVSSRDSLARMKGGQAWHPGSVRAGSRDLSEEDKLRFAYRAHLLKGAEASSSTAQTYWYGHGLIERNQLTKARSFAATLLNGSDVMRVTALVLEAEAGLAEGHFVEMAETLAASEAIYPPILRHLTVLGQLAPSLRPIVEPAIRRACESSAGPELSDFGLALIRLELAGQWHDDPVGSVCLRGFDALVPKLPKQKAFFSSCRAGVGLLLEGQVRAAIREWRKIRPLGWGCKMPPGLYDAVDAGLGSKLDAPYLEDRSYGGAHPAQAREARRAFDDGDVTRGRTLAERVIEAWRYRDVAVPVVDELRSRLRGAR